MYTVYSHPGAEGRPDVRWSPVSRAPRTPRVGVIGAGVIGRSWVRVFARAGFETRIWDPGPAQLDAAWTWLTRGPTRAPLPERRRMVRAASLRDALRGAVWVQESGPERIEAKRAIFAELDRLAPARAVLASSTSALDMSAIAEGLAGAGRCVVAHPVNPPHVVPVVEVVGGTSTDPRIVQRAVRFLAQVGQTPVLLRKFVPGFVLNRMQAALVREALCLVADGVCTPDGVDAVIRDGLGLRWALMGPFGVANTNADGGVREYLGRYGRSFERLWDDLRTDLALDQALIEQVAGAVDAATRSVPRDRQRAWRDDMVVRIRRLKTHHPMADKEPS